MTRGIPQTKIARYAAIARLLKTNKITSQADLRQRLQQMGIETTQATLSRDLLALRATKVRDTSGNSTYVLGGDKGSETLVNDPANGGALRLKKWCQDLLVVAVCNNNFVVLRTPAGAAQLLASALDNSILPEIIGCVGGDDTIFVMCTDNEAAHALSDKLLSYAED